jgi:tellurite resistance protein TerC
MIALIQITPWHWAGFIVFVLFFLALDLGLFNRGPRVVKFQEALRWSIFWCTLAMLFAAALVPLRGREEAVEFITGYVIELSLSMDNIFVIALIFAYFGVAQQFQHRVLFWGILGALVMRAAMIVGGAALIQRFQWTLYFFGAFLVYTGIRMMFADSGPVKPEQNPLIRLARKIFPVADGDSNGHFIVSVNGKKMLTTLALVLIMVETTDLVFALDSIPAIFAVTTKPFIIFTSNVFAILGLRSLYFVLAGAMGYFRYLKAGLSVVLVFVGAKMLFAPHGESHRWFQIEIPTVVSLAVIALILTISILLSIRATQREKLADAGQPK